MPNAKQTSGWEARLQQLITELGINLPIKVVLPSEVLEFIAQERIAVAKAMAEAVVPAPKKDGHPMLTDGEVDNYNRCRAEVSRRVEEFIAKL